MEKGKIIIVEGTSCVGKTTLCANLEQIGWLVIPEAIRYLENETQKSGDEASPIPNSQAEEEYYQNQLFRIELEKIREANYYSSRGYNVVIDKSAVATIATAKAFEKTKGFVGTYASSCSKYYLMLKQLYEDNLIECDGFLLLTADYNVIKERNNTRNHILKDIWLDENVIREQRNTLETFYENIIGKFSNNCIIKQNIDTTNLNKEEVLEKFLSFVNSFNNSNEEKSVLL